MPQANREYRDRLFKFIFGNPENRDWTLSLYNAINGSDYTDATQIRYTTVEDAVYMNMKNDVSFLVADTMSFYEQQSTFNPNMPMRFLIYAGTPTAPPSRRPPPPGACASTTARPSGRTGWCCAWGTPLTGRRISTCG